MPERFTVHIITTVRGDDGKLVTFDASYENEEEADKFLKDLEEAVPYNKLIQVHDDKRLEQSTWLASGQIIEVRKRHKHAGQR